MLQKGNKHQAGIKSLPVNLYQKQECRTLVKTKSSAVLKLDQKYPVQIKPDLKVLPKLILLSTSKLKEVDM